MNKLTTGLLLTGIFIISGLHSFGQEKLITVKGPIPVEKMGITLIHEHVLVDFIGADSTGYHRWEKAEVVERVLPFLLEAKARGVNTFFECTPAYLGRDPFLLKELSEKSGIHIVTNTGYYGARNNKYIPKHAFNDTPEDMARVWIDEFTNGIEGSGIFPGFIKIAVEREDTLSPMHAKIVKAAAIAHKATGLTIVSHTGTDGPAFAQLEILKEEGVSPDAFVWTHAQHGTLNGYVKAARQGAWVSLDHVKKSSDTSNGHKGVEWYVETLVKMKEEGLLHKILISHDAGWYRPGQPNGGNYRGYTDIFEYLLPALKKKGFTQKDIDVLLVKNPQKAYAVKIRTEQGQSADAQNAPYKGVDETIMSKLGWKVAIQCWTYNQLTFFDALDSIQSLGVHYVEMLSYQTVSKDIPQKSGPDMDRECLEKVKAKLEETGISAVAVWVDPFPKNEAAIRKLFSWARELGIETITTEPDPYDTAALAMAAKLCTEYKLKIAVHNHPVKTNNSDYKFWDPGFALAVVKPYSPHIGLCTDVGHWYRSGLEPLGCLKKVNGYINSVHFKDLNLNKQDVPLGTGVLNAPELLAELKRLDFKGVLTLEYESWGSKQHEEIMQSVEFLNNSCKELIDH
jgi:phosphotriesterase-related protein